MAEDVEALKHRVTELEALATPLLWKRRARDLGFAVVGVLLVLAVDYVSPLPILSRRANRYEIVKAELRNQPACWRLDRNTGELTLSVYDQRHMRTERAIAPAGGIRW